MSIFNHPDGTRVQECNCARVQEAIKYGTIFAQHAIKKSTTAKFAVYEKGLTVPQIAFLMI